MRNQPVLAAVAAVLLIMTASALMVSIEQPDGQVVALFLADLCVGAALLVYAFMNE